MFLGYLLWLASSLEVSDSSPPPFEITPSFIAAMVLMVIIMFALSRIKKKPVMDYTWC